MHFHNIWRLELLLAGIVIIIIIWRINIVLHLFKHLFDLLLYSFWVKFISLDYMRQFSLNIQFIELFDDHWVKLWDGNLILANKDDTVRVWTPILYLSVMQPVF